MPKKKTTLLMDLKLWQRLVAYTVKETGSARRISSIVENAVKEYLDRHSKGERTKGKP